MYWTIYKKNPDIRALIFFQKHNIQVRRTLRDELLTFDGVIFRLSPEDFRENLIDDKRRNYRHGGGRRAVPRGWGRGVCLPRIGKKVKKINKNWKK